MKVIFAHAADADLEEIGDYIASQNPTRAHSFIVELRRACRGLARFPLRFPALPGHEDLGLRRRVHGNYHIIYQVEARQVNIVRILHAARDYEALLFPED